MILMLGLLLEITLLLDMCPKICDHFWKFLSLPKTSIRTRVLSKRVNHGAGYGLEIPVCFIFQGHFKGIAWVKKNIEDAEKMVQSRIEKCKKNAL